MHTAHRIEIDPNNKQRTYFVKAAGVARFAYNWALCEWQKDYAEGLKPSDCYMRRKLNSIKRKDFPWMLDVTKTAPQEAIRDLGKAYNNFFKGRASYPKLRKKGVDDRFTITNDKYKIEGNRIWVSNLGWVKLKESFRFQGKKLAATFSKDVDRWFVSIKIDADKVWDKKSKQWISYPILRQSSASTGIDLGVNVFATLANEKEYISPKPYKNLLLKVRKKAKLLAKKKKGSRNRSKSKLNMARLHRKIRNIRNDFIHKTASEIVKEYSIIGLEDLNVSSMVKNHKLARSVSDMGFFEARRQITYKMNRQGESPVVADRWFPSSKLCSQCGFVKSKLPLHIRHWKCPVCSAFHKRDVNAAINLEKLAVSSTVKACGASSFSVSNKATRSNRNTRNGASKQESNIEFSNLT